jgi:hypothetical protein
MDNSIKNGALQTVRVYLSPNENFKLYITLIQHDKKRYMIDAMLGYKNQFVSKNYQETRYLLETIGLFAHRFELDIDCDDFEVVQQKSENQKSKKTLLCKFLKTDTPDKDIYLNRGMCKTIQNIFYDAMLGYSKTFGLEQRLHDDVFPSVVHNQIKLDNINAVNNASQHLQIINDADMPDQVKDMIRKYIESYDDNA